jgi:hypothetical protein
MSGYPLPDPTFHRVVVAEEGEKIVAAWWMLQVVHLEPVWIDPAHRSSILPVKMLAEMSRILDSCTVKQAFCFADRPEIAGYLQRLGMQKLPYETYLFEVPSCHKQQW